MTIHSGDCHNILITLPRETFDAMITDPPYGLLEKKQTNDRKSKTLKSMSSWDRISYNWIPKAIELLKPNANIVIFTDWMRITEIVNALRECGCTPKDLFRYEKTRPMIHLLDLHLMEFLRYY